MGLLDLPPNHAEVPGLKLYSLWLKLLGNVFLGIFPVAYILKWGVAWHDAGSPFNIAGADGINFNAYWDMILIIYTTLGIYLIKASFNPAAFKPFLSWFAWGGNLSHGIIATIHCFTDQATPASRYQYTTFGGVRNLDKLLVAVPLWFGSFAGNTFFNMKVFGSILFPTEDLTKPTYAGGKVYVNAA